MAGNMNSTLLKVLNARDTDGGCIGCIGDGEKVGDMDHWRSEYNTSSLERHFTCILS